MSRKLFWSGITVVLVIIIAAGLLYFYWENRPTAVRATQVFIWLKNPASHPEWKIQAGVQCNNAPFAFPTTGMIGFLWGDTIQFGARHQGVDIFSGTDIGITRVTAAYDGYLTRLADWKSAVIERVPNDPLHPERQIWIYYTHMADANGNSFISSEFPAGTSEKQITMGTFLGYMGDYSGDPNSPVGVHLHISIDKDDHGHFMNELNIDNTYDPSPYFGMELNAEVNKVQIPTCTH
jgi:peptidoglycan LD-endopeptidase LytH